MDSARASRPQRAARAQQRCPAQGAHARLVDRFGALPEPVERLFDVARLRALVRAVGLAEIVAQGAKVRFFPVELPESASLRLSRLYPGTIIKPAVRTILVPRPSTARVGGEPLRDAALLQWATDLIGAVLMVAKAA